MVEPCQEVHVVDFGEMLSQVWRKGFCWSIMFGFFIPRYAGTVLLKDIDLCSGRVLASASQLAKRVVNT